MADPTVHVYEFDITKIDPSPTRHIANGSFAFVKELGSGTLADYMEFDNFTDSGLGHQLSRTQVFVFRTSTTGFLIDNMRFWAPDITALNAASSLFQYGISGVWQAFADNAASGVTDMVPVPTVLPVSSNLSVQDGVATMSGINDVDVSQYVYLSLVLDDSYPNGRYGGQDIGSSGRFECRVTYDYTTDPTFS